LVEDDRTNGGAATSQLQTGPADPSANTTGPLETADPTSSVDDADESIEDVADEDEAYDEDGIYEETEQGFVHIRTSLFAIGATIASVLILALIAGNVYQFIHNRDGATVATVNGSPITASEFVRAAGDQDQALQSLIDQKLIQQEAKKEKVTVPDTQVNNEVAAIKQQLGSQAQFNAALQKANLSESDLRDQIRTKDLAQLMGAKGVTVSDTEAQTFFTQNQAQFGTQTFDQAKPQIEQQLLQSKQTEAIQNWISGLHSGAKIAVNIPS